MMSVEQTKCFRVGRRRFLTKRAALDYLARTRMAAMRACACEVAEYDGGYCTSPGYTCPVHDERIRRRYARLLRQAWKRGWRPEQERKERDPGLQILQHALGLDDCGQGNAYRTRFVTSPGTVDWPICLAHEEAGRMERRGPHELFGGEESYCFVVTEAGREYVREHSALPPKATRSQRRYRRFLNADCGLTFGEWLRSEMSR
jgi:hypothetical protein